MRMNGNDLAACAVIALGVGGVVVALCWASAIRL